MPFPALAQPGKIGALEIKNRIVMAALNNNYTRAAFMTEESIDFYVSRARGGAGLVIIEATSVDYPRSRSCLNPSIDDDKYLPPIVRIVDGCHGYGAKVFIQLSHVGRQTRKAITGMDPVAPSPVASNSPLYPDQPKVLTIDGIKEIVGKFGAAALRAKKAGMDGVELIFAHGYLGNNFLTPASNQRTDEYGGIRGGIKYCVEVIRKIKETCGEDFVVMPRINGDDFIKEGGNTPVEAQLVAQELVKAGANAINVSGGMRDSELSFNDHTAGSPHGAWIHLADRIKRVVDVPVMAVKRFTPQLAEETVAAGKADFICFGKQWIADPDFANKVLEDRLDDILYCTSCCQGCYDAVWQKTPIRCMVNQDVGRPMDYRRAREARRGNERVLVVGGGPAGCEAALEAAKKGHTVTLIERSGRLGGNYRSCELTDAKKEVGDLFAYIENALAKSTVTVRLNTEFTPALVDELAPTVVVDATGADFKMPNIEGTDAAMVVNPIEAMDGSRLIGDYVAVVSCAYDCSWTCRRVSHPIPDDVVGLETVESHACSAGHAAADVAEELAKRGKKVFIIAARDAFVPGMGFTNRGNMFKRFFPANITVSTNTRVKRVVLGGLVCEREGMEFTVSADTVVMSTGLTPRHTVEEALTGRNIKYFKVGDAATVGNAFQAFATGYEIVDQF